jgi:branched-chain amino acid aminotransferase
LSDKKTYAFFEGRYVPIEDANINIMTHGFLYGTAVFEGIRAYWNKDSKELYIFRMREHFERMFDSMKIMYLDCKYSVDELCDMVIELLRRNAPEEDVYIRPGVYKAAKRIGPSLDNNPSELYIFTVPFGDYFHGAPGLKVMVSNWRRVEDNAIPARAKIIGAYCNTALAKTDAVMAGFDDCIVLTEHGHVSEGSAMNIFMVKNGRLITSSTTENILEGITRETIMEMAEKEFGLKTEVRSIDRSELYVADELFFSGTGAQVTPIIEVDRRKIGSGDVGPVSEKVRSTYQAICHGKVDKYKHWLTPVYAGQKVKAKS